MLTHLEQLGSFHVFGWSSYCSSSQFSVLFGAYNFISQIYKGLSTRNQNTTDVILQIPSSLYKYRQKTTTYKYRHHFTNTDKKQPPTNTVIILQIQTENKHLQIPSSIYKYRQKTTTYKYRHHFTNTDKKQPHFVELLFFYSDHLFALISIRI